MTKILMRKTIVTDSKILKTHRNARYNQRACAASGMSLNFRCGGHPIESHSIRGYLTEYKYPTHQGMCLVCGHGAEFCTCKIEVMDSNGNISFLDM